MRNAIGFKKVDGLGRVVIPIDIRRQLKIDCEEELEVFCDGKSVIYKKSIKDCSICHGTKNLHDFEGQLYCDSCIHKLSQILVR